MISIDVKYADIIKDLRLFISEDSEEWYQLNDIDGFMILDEQLFIRSTDLKFKYIKILYESEVENYLTININVCRQKS